MTEHSPEPWRYLVGGGLVDGKGLMISPELPGEGRRIEVCVNACKGIPTELLETLLKHEGVLSRGVEDFMAAVAGELPAYGVLLPKLEQPVAPPSSTAEPN